VLVRNAISADLPTVRRLVARAGLPLDGLDDAAVLVGEAEGRIVGVVALEQHGSGPSRAFLLRSAAVDPDYRSRGVGAALVRAALDRVDSAGAPVALLTETAAGYFLRFGFVPVNRTELPSSLEASAELRGACPASAQAFLRVVGAA
jgi:amino-acid N-acetyltransferase